MGYRAAYLWGFRHLTGQQQVLALQTAVLPEEQRVSTAKPEVIQKLLVHRLILATSLLFLENCTASETHQEYLAHVLTPYRL